MASARLIQSLNLLLCTLLLLKTEGFNVGITYVQNAVAKGAGEKLLPGKENIKIEPFISSFQISVLPINNKLLQIFVSLCSEI
jgi:hypothetical protein